MAVERPQARKPSPARGEMQVVCDLAEVLPVTGAELDAIEAFLMPLLRGVIEDSVDDKNAGPEEQKGFNSLLQMTHA
jgi:hypothetical protein